jgi:hypothetical protein
MDYPQNSRFGRGAPQNETADEFHDRQIEQITRQMYQAVVRGQPTEGYKRQLDALRLAKQTASGEGGSGIFQGEPNSKPQDAAPGNGPVDRFLTCVLTGK